MNPKNHTWGKLALKLYIVSYHKTGIDLSKEWVSFVTSQTAEAIGANVEDVVMLMTRIAIPSAALGATDTKNTGLTKDKLDQMIVTMTTGMVNNDIDILEKTALAVVSYLGRDWSPADFKESMEMLMQIGIASETELLAFYIERIVAPSLCWVCNGKEARVVVMPPTT